MGCPALCGFPKVKNSNKQNNQNQPNKQNKTKAKQNKGSVRHVEVAGLTNRPTSLLLSII